MDASPRVSAVASRRWMLALALTAALAHVVDLAWSRADGRAGSPASVVFATCVFALLSLYPDGRPTPRWTLIVAGVASAMFTAATIAGPDAAAAFRWPLPIAPPLLALVIGGQGFRYLRRSRAREREAARWPLLGTLLLVTLVVPADLISVATTGATIDDSSPAMGVVVGLAFLLPILGFVAGLVAPPNAFVDRALAVWLTVVLTGGVFGAVFAVALAIARTRLDATWSAVIAGAAALTLGVFVVPPTRRLADRVVFRGRRDLAAALTRQHRRLGTTLDPADLPAQFVESVRDAVGSSAVVLRRTGHAGVWAQAGPTPRDAGPATTTTVVHLGLEVASLDVWPRAAESALSSADLRLIRELVGAAAPALHGARLSGAFPELTDREQQVLAAITRGLPNSAIAARLGVVGQEVVDAHIRRTESGLTEVSGRRTR